MGNDYSQLVKQLEALPDISYKNAELVEAAISVWRRPGFDTFASLTSLRFEPFDYQLRAAATVLRQMSGRSILADEVGLGKTIEAGIVCAELRLRGLARKILVLTPAGIVGQWGEELERKFGIPTEVATLKGWGQTTKSSESYVNDEVVSIVSLASARRPEFRDLLNKVSWDLVVIDEAHRVRNPKTASSKLVRSLKSRYMLLLTATPVENRLDDLYHLVSLIRPGHLGTIGDFRRKHVSPVSSKDNENSPNVSQFSTQVKALDDLKHSLRSVMIRHRRSEVALMLPRRLAETIVVTPTPEEVVLYSKISDKVREEARSSGSGRSMVLRTVQRLAGSSPKAAARTLEHIGWEDLSNAALEIETCSKTDALGALIKRHISAGEKVIVFTSFRETLAQLSSYARLNNFDAVEYHGGLSRKDKDSVINTFENNADILLSTESAGEGRNLQFCHVMINFDLPWNPMQIEQRLGRIHRFGQDHDVILTNLAGKGTIEENILNVLHSKLNMFELVVGELDMVLGRVSEDFVFEDAVFEAHVSSQNDKELAEKLDNLGSLLLEARVEHTRSREWVDELAIGLDNDDDDDDDESPLSS